MAHIPFIPVGWQPGSAGLTPLDYLNLANDEERLMLLDELYRGLGGTDATMPSAIGISQSFLGTDGVSPRWRSPSQARADLFLVVGTNVQAWDALLDGLAALTVAANKLIYATGADTFSTTDFTPQARQLLDDASFAAMRTTLGLGTIATQNAAAVAITGGTIAGVSTADVGTLTTNGDAVVGENLEVWGQAYSPPVTLAIASTITPDGNEGNNFVGTLTGSHTMAAVINPQAGAVYNFLIKKSGSGKTLAWNAAYKFPGGIDAALSSGANPDMFSFFYDGSGFWPAGKNLS